MRAAGGWGQFSMSIFEHPDFTGHEQVLYCHDPAVGKTGLKAIIAIHSTKLGPAAGGCRMHPYESEQAALTDALRLSQGMSFKNSVAGLPLGGGKCVIIADPAAPGKEELLRAFAKHVQNLNGRYWTAIDIGVGPEDADILAENCDYIFARASQYEPGFNPSSFTALGGFIGIKAALGCMKDGPQLKGLRVAVQGLGATGYGLSRHLHEAGALLTVADVKHALVEKAVAEFDAIVATPEQIHATDVDVLAPCAMGATLNDNTIPEIRAKIICGLANNQLAEARHGAALLKQGITYVPDYVVNAGGMMGASMVIFTEPSREASLKRIEGLCESIQEIITRSLNENRPTSEIANELALARIDG